VLPTSTFSTPVQILIGIGIGLVVLLLAWLFWEKQRRLMFAFAFTLFVSASLLFLVQPLVGKLLLPYMGGTPAVWNTCMVFFQALLLAGYAYAHLLTRIEDPRKQLLVHALVLLLPLAPLFLLGYFNVGIVASFWPAPSVTNPIPWLLMVLLLTAGLPFFAVSATAPLLQKWFAGTDHPDAKDPYFLYGASNVGSMGALLAYPALVEWAMKLSEQRFWWTMCYLVLIGLILLAGVLALTMPARRRVQLAGAEGDTAALTGTGVTTTAGSEKGRPAEGANTANDDAGETGRVPTVFDRIRWVLLAFVPSSVMLGVTTYMTTDIAAMPLLWILPLALYISSFIFVFSRLPMWLTISAVLLLPVFLAGWLNASAALEFTSWEGFYESSKKFLNTPLRDLNLHHLLVLALGGMLVATCFRTPTTIHTLMVVMAPLAGLAIAFEWEIRRFLELRNYEAILLHLGVLYVVAMACHGELARTRPRTRYLTEFYLLMSLGGVLGGMFNTLLAPVVYDRVWEYPLVVAFMLLLMPWPGSEKEKGWDAADSWTVAVFGFAVGLLLLVLFVARVTVQQKEAMDWVQKNFAPQFQPVGQFLASQLPDDEGTDTTTGSGWQRSREVIWRERNFFGTFTVVKYTYAHPADGKKYVYHKMYHGTTTHGMQLVSTTNKDPDAQKTTDPLTYFHRTGPIGDLFRDRARLDRPLKMAVLGVGTGTLAAYAQKGWEITLFEIDPAVVKVARDPNYFTYLSDAEARGATVKVILGDGRQEFKKVEDGQFDLIFMDAFTSDAVPVHLLTQEAAEMYMNKLAPGGLIIFNIANRYLSFEPILGNLCAKEGWAGLVGYGEEDLAIDRYGNAWVVIGKDEESLGMLPYVKELNGEGEASDRWQKADDKRPWLGVWTDDYANLFSVFKWYR
jgi:hypothetical protein